MDHVRGIMNYMIPIIRSAVFNDLTVVCSDSFLSTAVGILAISFPESMGGALASGEVDVLLLPQHTMVQVRRGVAARRSDLRPALPSTRLAQMTRRKGRTLYVYVPTSSLMFTNVTENDSSIYSSDEALLPF